MNAPEKLSDRISENQVGARIAGLQKLRAPFAENHISKLPKPTKKQTEEVRADYKKGVRCKLCESWHHPDVVHLDYVGHAALTDRLLDTDLEWSWEPLVYTEFGLPAFDQTGGLWIKLTVLGVTRLGYGHAATKPNADPGSREKEVIGDALRNAAMRFGAALDLWHKGDLHADSDTDAAPAQDDDPAISDRINEAEWNKLSSLLEATNSDVKKFCEVFKCSSVREMSAAAYPRALDKLQQKLANMKAEQPKVQDAEFSEVNEADLPY